MHLILIDQTLDTLVDLLFIRPKVERGVMLGANADTLLVFVFFAIFVHSAMCTSHRCLIMLRHSLVKLKSAHCLRQEVYLRRLVDVLGSSIGWCGELSLRQVLSR